MATQICRVGYNVLRRTIYSNIRASSQLAGPHKAPEVPDPEPDAVVPENFRVARGTEKYEMLAKMKGIDDPWQAQVKTQDLGQGTFDSPNLIPSAAHFRMVGCLCDEDAIEVKWTLLDKGVQRQCECGKWFRLLPIEAEGLEA